VLPACPVLLLSPAAFSSKNLSLVYSGSLTVLYHISPIYEWLIKETGTIYTKIFTKLGSSAVKKSGE